MNLSPDVRVHLSGKNWMVVGLLHVHIAQSGLPATAPVHHGLQLETLALDGFDVLR